MIQKFEGNDGLDLPAGKRSIYKRTKENQIKAQMISERGKKNSSQRTKGRKDVDTSRNCDRRATLEGTSRQEKLGNGAWREGASDFHPYTSS
jgi:hypothetical protein